VATQEMLFRWGLAETDLCRFCEEEIESLPHILVECEVIKPIWTQIQQWLFHKTNQIFPITKQEIIFGITNREHPVFNAIFILAKRYILGCMQHSEFPSLYSFTQKVKDYLNIERCISQKNYKLQIFMNRWNIFV